MVDKRSFTELYSANYPSFPKQNNNNRLLRFRMGDMVRERSFSRTLVRRRNKMAHKFKGIDGWFYRSEVVCERSTLSDSHQSSDGQYDCLSLYKPHRWNSFCQSLHAGSRHVEVVSTKKYPHFSCLHPRATQLQSRHTAPINKSQFRMETQSSNFSSDLCDLHNSRFRSFCNKSKQSTSEIHFMVPRSRCSDNAFTIPWSNQLCYAFPPYSQIMKCLKKIQFDKAKVLLIDPVWRLRPWFPILLLMLYYHPLLLPSTSDLLLLPSDPERMPQKQVTSAVWPLSGDASVSANFLRGCPTSSYHHVLMEVRDSGTV